MGSQRNVDCNQLSGRESAKSSMVGKENEIEGCVLKGNPTNFTPGDQITCHVEYCSAFSLRWLFFLSRLRK